jgi:DNA-binding LacI/PurR family transcriptional regulator
MKVSDRPLVTVTDVARRAGVSLATVSRVQNGNMTVAPEMREKVNAAIAALGYRPNPMAQGLRKGRSNTVALLVGDLAQRHFSELTLHVQTALEDVGMDLMLFNQGHSDLRLDDFFRRATSMSLRGVAIAMSHTVPASIAPMIAALQKNGTMVVSIGQNLTRFGVPSVVYEEKAASRRAVEYLIGRGHTRIAYVGRLKGSAIGTERFRGYKAALEAAGCFDPALVWDRKYRYAAGREAVLDALDRGLVFTGLQAGSDEIAAGAMAGLRDRDRDVPGDVAIIGFGDVEMGAYLRPALTTLSSDPRAAAAHVRGFFEAGLAGQAGTAVITIERSLVHRDSA